MANGRALKAEAKSGQDLKEARETNVKSGKQRL